MRVRYAGIKDFSGYKVGTDGSVWSCRRKGRRPNASPGEPLTEDGWHRLKTPTIRNGYPTVALRDCSGKVTTHYVHKLVMEAFVGPCPDGMEVCHDPDRTKTNCNLTNLKYGTRTTNSDDQRKHGTRQRGERNGHAVLTDRIVITARRKHAKGGVTITNLAAEHNVARATMSAAVRGDSWKHLAT